MMTVMKMKFLGLEHLKILSEKYRYRTLTARILGFFNDASIEINKK